jgi:hypothetical protein
MIVDAAARHHLGLVFDHRQIIIQSVRPIRYDRRLRKITLSRPDTCEGASIILGSRRLHPSRATWGMETSRTAYDPSDACDEIAPSAWGCIDATILPAHTCRAWQDRPRCRSEHAQR